MQGTEVPEHRKGYLLKSRSSGRCPHRKRKAQTSAKNKTARSASAQPDERQPQAGTVSTTREFSARATQSRTFQVARFLGSAPIQPLSAPALHRRQRVLMETESCIRAPSPTTGPHGDGELFLRSIADNGSLWRRERLPCSAGSFAHQPEASTLAVTEIWASTPPDSVPFSSTRTFSEQATSDPTPLSPLVTVRAGT